MLLRTLSLALGVLVAGCSNEPDPPARVALWQLFESRVEADRRPTEPIGQVVFRERFDEPPIGWHAMVDATDPLAPAPPDFAAASVGEGGDARLALSGSQGGLYRLIDVEPNSFLDVSARVRFSELVPKNAEGFTGATLFIGELSRRGTPRKVFEEGIDDVLVSRTTLSLVGRDGRWATTSRQFRAGDDTRALVVMCLLGIGDDAVLSGAAEFDDVTVRALDEHEYRRAEAEGAGGTKAELAQRHGASRVRASVGAESRPSLLVLPDRALTLDVVVPRGKPVLEFGAAPWSVGAEVASRFGYRVNIDGREAIRVDAVDSTRAVDRRWRPTSFDLGEFAGDEVRLTFTAVGAAVVFGAPLLRDRARRTPGPNLVLVSIDTLRADHVGAYGYDGATTPHFDALAREGQFYSDMTAQAPYTLPSQTSMFSGQMPSVHGVVSPGRAISKERTPLLADLLFDAGVTTRAFTGGGFLDAEFGFDRGFQGYSNVDPWRYPESPHGVEMVRRSPDSLSKELLAEYTPGAVEGWLEDHREERFFLFVHTYTVHDFDPPPGYLDERERIDPMPYLHHEYILANGITPEAIGDIRDYYDAALRYVDELLGSLVAKLEELGLADDTIVAVTSDHGKELGERGLVIHGTTLYEELIAVPLVLRVPGMAPGIDARPVMSVDLAPTLLAAMGLEIDARMQGADLLDPRVRLDERPVWSEVDQLALKYSLRAPSGMKLIYGPPDDGRMFPNERTWELYDLDADPGELTELSDERAELRAELGGDLSDSRSAFESLGEAYGGIGSGSMSAATRARLEQLGYL